MPTAETEGRVVDTVDFDTFRGLESEWDAMVLAAEHPLPFLGHVWIRTWWLHFGSDQEFLAVVVREGEKLLAAVPLALRRALGGRVTVGEIVGTGPVPTRGMGLSDKAELVVRAECPDARGPLLRALLGLLERVDVLDVKGLDEASSGVAELLDGAAACPVRSIGRSVSPFLPLPATWDEYLGSRSRNFRKHLRKYWRGLQKLGSVEIERLEDEADVDTWSDDVFAINRASWKAERGTNLFRHPALQAFYRDLVRELLSGGMLDLRRLRIDGRTVAYELCFDFGGRIFSYNGSYLGELSRHSPGTVLTAVVIESACDEGRAEYDMLRGDEPYKLRWSNLVRTESQVVISANRALSRAYAWTAVYAKARLRQSERLSDLADRLSGLTSRLLHR